MLLSMVGHADHRVHMLIRHHPQRQQPRDHRCRGRPPESFIGAGGAYRKPPPMRVASTNSADRSHWLFGAVGPRTHMQLSDLRLSVSRYGAGKQRRRSQPWGFKSLSDTCLRTCGQPVHVVDLPCALYLIDSHDLSSSCQERGLSARILSLAPVSADREPDSRAHIRGIPIGNCAALQVMPSPRSVRAAGLAIGRCRCLGQEVEQGLRGAGGRAPCGDDCADVTADRWCDLQDGDLRRDGAQAHRGQDGDAEPVLHEFGEVLHVLRFADGSPGKPGGGAGYVDLGV